MSRTVCLLYHDLDSASERSSKEDAAGYDTVVDVENFRAHMRILSERGVKGCSWADYTRALAAGENPENHVILTFDDGHVSAHSLAAPVLSEFGFTASFYLISGKVDTDNYVSADQARALLEVGMEIGSHTINHPFLRELEMDEIEAELVGSKAALESMLGVEIVSLAYPGGHYDDRVVDVAKRAGYTSAMSCRVGYVNEDSDPFLIHRLEIRRGTDASGFASSLSAGSIRFYRALEWVKDTIRRSIGLSAYRNLRARIYHLYPFKR